MSKHPTLLSVLSPEAILAIPLAEPERLFPEPGDLASQWRDLAAAWHPDRHPDAPRATEVLQHINALYTAAKRKLAAGEWSPPGRLRLTATDGRQFQFRFRRRSPFELGETYIGGVSVAYAVRAADADLFAAADVTLRNLGYPDPRMRDEMAHHLPSVRATVETADRRLLVVRKSSDDVALSDLVDHLGGKLAARHVAWIVSGLENIACYLDWAGLMHGGIAPETVFVSPRGHIVSLLGGWWYARRFGEAIRVLPERSARLLSPSAGGRAIGSLDLECIRQVAREALGDPTGGRLLRDKDIPKPFAEWLALPPAATAFADYRSWEAAREAAFGRRRFTELPVDPAGIYPPVE